MRLLTLFAAGALTWGSASAQEQSANTSSLRDNAREAGQTIERDTRQAADTVKQETREAVETVRRESRQAEHTISREARATGAGVKREAKAMNGAIRQGSQETGAKLRSEAVTVRRKAANSEAIKPAPVAPSTVSRNPPTQQRPNSSADR